MNAIFHRTSIRKYAEQAVGQEKIEKMLRAAMAAPSAGNQIGRDKSSLCIVYKTIGDFS